MLSLKHSGILVKPSSRSICVSTYGRYYSTTKNQRQKNDEIENQKKEAAKLAIQSMKDIGSMFGSSSDDATQPIDVAPIYEDPTIFPTLSLLHQGQVVQDLQNKFDKKWTKLTMKEKRLAYYVYYGDWGVRQAFSNWNTLEAPFDLPFHTPSKIKTTDPKPNTIISEEIPRVVLSETNVRKKDFDLKRVDGVTKFFIYLTLFISVLAIYRDKFIGEDGIPTEIKIEDKYEIERRRKIEEENQKKAEEAKESKKWYFLWLK